MMHGDFARRGGLRYDFEYMRDNFDAWNEIKKEVHLSEENAPSFPKAGEVWMCTLGRNIGFEQNGSGDNFSRPILVVKKFNNKMFWSIPLSTQQKKFDFYYNFTDPNKQKVSVILAQLRLVSVKRLKRKMYDMSLNDFLKIKQFLRGFLM